MRTLNAIPYTRAVVTVRVASPPLGGTLEALPNEGVFLESAMSILSKFIDICIYIFVKGYEYIFVKICVYIFVKRASPTLVGCEA